MSNIFEKLVNFLIILCLLYISRPIMLFENEKTKQFGLGCCRTMFSMEFLVVLFAILL